LINCNAPGIELIWFIHNRKQVNAKTEQKEERENQKFNVKFVFEPRKHSSG